MGQENSPITTLQRIFSKFGSELLDDTFRLQGLIRDYLGSNGLAYPLIKSLEDDVLQRVMDIGGSEADPLELDRLAKSLHHDLLYDAKLAKDIVEVWYQALQGLKQEYPTELSHPQTTTFFRGSLVSPSLQKAGWKLRLGRGGFIAGYGLDEEHILLVFSGGIGLFCRGSSKPQGWIETLAVSAALAPDGQHLAVGQPGGAIELWDLKDGRCRYTLMNHTLPITALEFSSDGQYLAAGDEGGSIIVWDTTSGWATRQWKNRSGAVHSLTFQPNTDLLVSASGDYSVQIWDMVSGEPRGDLLIHELVRSLAFSPDGRYLVTAGDQQRVTLRSWGLETPPKHLVDHPDVVHKVKFLPNGELLSISNQAVLGCRIENEYPIIRYQVPGFNPLGAVVLADGNILIVETDEHKFRVRDIKGESLWLELEVDVYSCHALTFSPQGDWLAFADSHRMRLLQHHTGFLTNPVDGHRFDILDLAYSPDGLFLVSCGGDGVLRLWDAANQQPFKVLWQTVERLTTVRFAPNGKMLAFGSEDGSIILLTMPDGKLVRQRTNTSTVIKLTFSPDGRFLATGGEDGSLNVWDARVERLIYSIEGLYAPVRAVAMSGDSRWLVSGGEDGKVRIFDLQNGKEQNQIELPAWVTCLAFRPTDQKLIIGCGDGSVCFYTLSRQSVDQFLHLHADTISALAFSLDGRLLASAGGDHTIALWEVS